MVTPTTLCCSPRSQVTLAEAVPVAGSGLTLPLDLFHIAARCNGAYFASKRFAAVQLAYTHPRCRVLVFHTGRLVGTGCSGPMAARLAIARAQRQLAEDAGVHLHTRNFSVSQIAYRTCTLLTCQIATTNLAHASPFRTGHQHRGRSVHPGNAQLRGVCQRPPGLVALRPELLCWPCLAARGGGLLCWYACSHLHQYCHDTNWCVFCLCLCAEIYSTGRAKYVQHLPQL